MSHCQRARILCLTPLYFIYIIGTRSHVNTVQCPDIIVGCGKKQEAGYSQLRTLPPRNGKLLPEEIPPLSVPAVPESS
jgi:hypothetical protein